MTISSFVQALSAFAGEAVFNPYADTCPLHDRLDAPKIRRTNVYRMLDAAIQGGASTLWVARDLGYRGGRRTGLALTDEAHLSALEQKMNSNGFRRATKGPVMAERTATVIWDMLSRIDEPVMLWNIFPFHPHQYGEPMTNRCHTKREREDALPFLFDLIDLLKPKRVVAIGRDSALALEGFGLPMYQARHPSYGGQSLFVKQMETLYELTSQASSQQTHPTPCLTQPA